MFGYVVLRDIPKEEVRIDGVRETIQGGFRGFSMVPPAAWHYVSVKDGDYHRGFWFWLNPNEVVVRVYESEAGFVEDAESTTQYTPLAQSGAMGGALRPYRAETFGPWFGLVMHIPHDHFPPTLHANDPDLGHRWDNALQGTHGGDGNALLAEFQWAFVRWLVSLDTPETDEEAFARWRHLVLASYNAGERRIAPNGELFVQWVDVLLRQFPLLPDSWFTADSFLVVQAGYLAEDMQDCGIAVVAEKGKAFATYLASR